MDQNPFRVNIPQDFEPRFRYQGEQRFVTLYHTKHDENPIFSDGLMTKSAEYSAYIKLMKELGRQLAQREEDNFQSYMREHLKNTKYSGTGAVTIDEFLTYCSENLLKLDTVLQAIGFNIYANHESNKRDASFIIDLQKRELYLSNTSAEDIVEEITQLNSK